jgi:hypothetical protein
MAQKAGAQVLERLLDVATERFQRADGGGGGVRGGLLEQARGGIVRARAGGETRGVQSRNKMENVA